MSEPLTLFQTNGIKKLIALRGLLFCPEVRVNDSSLNNLYKSFIDILCEHQLADNDYCLYFYHNLSEITSLNTKIEYLLKQLTFILWTDTITLHFFEGRLKDGTLFQLLNSLEEVMQLLNENECVH